MKKHINITNIKGINYLPEPATCTRFGCGKTLTREEALHGKICMACQGIEKVDVMKVLKFK